MNRKKLPRYGEWFGAGKVGSMAKQGMKENVLRQTNHDTQTLTIIDNTKAIEKANPEHLCCSW